MNKGSLQPQAAILPVRRVVTGHDDQGRSRIIVDEASPHVTPFMGIPGFAVTDLWQNTTTPAEIAVASDPCSLPLKIAPPTGGAVVRTTQFPPGGRMPEPLPIAAHIRTCTRRGPWTTPSFFQARFGW